MDQPHPTRSSPRRRGPKPTRGSRRFAAGAAWIPACAGTSGGWGRLLLPVALTGALALAGCGFAPLYAQPGVVKKLAAVDVIAPQGRAGFLMREHLDDYFGKKLGEKPDYRMHLAVSETRYPRGVRIDNVATRYEYVLTADYRLDNLPSETLAKSGRVHVEVTYDSPDQPYASVSAQQDAEDRAAEEAARRIQMELAAWIATGKPTAKRVVQPPITPPVMLPDTNAPLTLPTGS